MAKKSPAALSSDHAYVVNPAQLGGIDLLSQIDGPAAGTRCAWVNTGSGLHYKVLVDRGLDIAEAFYKGMSLSWLSLSGAPRPEMAMHRGLDWLWGFFGGLVASCGPSSAGAPCKDGTEELGLHGRHTNLSASLESVVGPDPLRGLTEMSITGVVRQAKLFEPNLELRRTITSPLVPWNTCAAFMAATLGVATLDYLPFVFFNLVNFALAFLAAAVGFRILPRQPDEGPAAALAPGAPVADTASSP